MSVSIIVHENNKLEETIFLYQPTLKVEVRWCESIMYISTLIATSRPLIHLALFKWPQIWHKGAQSHMWNNVWTMPCELGLKFSRKSCIHSTSGFHLESVHVYLPKSLLASCNKLKNVMVRWHITLWPQNTIWTNLKVAYTIHKLWSTVVWPNKASKFLNKFKIAQNFLKPASLMASSVCQLLSIKKKKQTLTLFLCLMPSLQKKMQTLALSSNLA